MGGYDLLDYGLDRHDLLHNLLHLFDSLLDIGHFLNNLPILNFLNNLLLNPQNLLHMHLLLPNSNNLLHNLRHLHNPLLNLGNRDYLLDNLLNGDGHLDGDDDLAVDFDDLGAFDCDVDYFLDFDVAGDLFYYFDYFLDYYFVVYDLLFVFWDLNELVYNPFDYLLYFNVDILGHFDLDYLILDHRHLHNLLNFLNLLLNNNLRHNPLDNLRYLNNLLNNPGHNNNLLHNLLNLDNLGHFHHLLNNLLNGDLNFLNPIDIADDLDYFLFDIFDGFGDIDVMVYDAFDFDCFGLFYDYWVAEVDLFYYC